MKKAINFTILISSILLFSCSTFSNFQKKEFTGEVVFLKTDFTDLSDLQVRDKEFYNNNDVWFSSDKIYSNPNKSLSIDCVYDPETHTSWQGTRTTNWTSGMLQGKFSMNYGTWIFRAKLPDSWPAIWLLREVYQYNEDIKTITPEVDIVEVIHGKFKNTIHYTPTATEYASNGKGKSFKYDNEWHEFAVDVRIDGYDFYQDGKRTAKFRGKGDMVSDKNSYFIINNAIQPKDNPDPAINYKMEIGLIKVLKNKWTTNINLKPIK